jgi:hypothetical protein
MKKYHFLWLFLALANFCFAQKPIESTNEFTIMGLVEKPLTIPFSKILQEKNTNIGDFTVTNHLGEFKQEYKNVKGVALLDLMKDVKITASSPKLLSEYYFIFKGSDGYSVVFSWNEIFNTEVGKTIFIVTETNNKSQLEGTERILLISSKDFKTGRRHVKGLKTIEVKRI